MLINFYDSHGPSCASYAEGNKMEVNYWDRWYANAREGQTSENFTYTFNAPEGYDVKVVFKRFTAYGAKPGLPDFMFWTCRSKEHPPIYIEQISRFKPMDLATSGM